MMVFADELAMHLLPKVGAAWMLQGTQAEVMTPGKQVYESHVARFSYPASLAGWIIRSKEVCNAESRCPRRLPGCGPGDGPLG
ncbi:MAG TPA: hypothetical protein VI542_02955 [Candidatus Tectomicrobia bacterium]